MTQSSPASLPAEPLSLVLKRRLVGLLVLLMAGLLGSLLLRSHPAARSSGSSQSLETIVIPLGGSTAAESAAEQSAAP